MTSEFWDACYHGHVERAKEILLKNIKSDVNFVNNICWGWTPLHIACARGHAPIVSFLLVQPGILINAGDNTGWTPLSVAVRNGYDHIVKILVKDVRCEINSLCHSGISILHSAVSYGRVNSVKILIATGMELTIFESVKAGHPIAIAKHEKNDAMVVLLERFQLEPERLIRELRVELEYYDRKAAKLFALVIFCCDDLLVVNGEQDDSDCKNHSRFFKITQRLPMELQMILCRRAVDSMRNVIIERHSEKAFRDLVKKIVVGVNAK